MTLKSKLARAFAFDEDDCRSRMKPANTTTDVEDMVNGALQHVARLRPILDSLSECVELLPAGHDSCEDCFYACPMSEDYCGYDSGCNCGALERIAALQRLAEKLEPAHD